MDWQSFYRQIATLPSGAEHSTAGEFEVGLDKGLPTAKLRITLGEKTSTINEIDGLKRLAESWTEHDVARRLTQLNAALFVDDSERGSAQLTARLADLAKVLTESFVAENSRILFAGSGDIYHRLYAENPSLEDRLKQVSLGGFKRPAESVKLLTLGFNKLDLRHPWNSDFPQQTSKQSVCANAVWEAGDGLPKSINSLGYEIAINARGKRGVSWSEILEESKIMAEKHWIEYAQRFPDIVDYLYEHPIAVKVVGWIYGDGITNIHNIYDLSFNVNNGHATVSAQECLQAIAELANLDFLVRTGRNGELVFVKHPTAAHLLGVAMRDPQSYRQVLELQRGRPSITEAFPIPTDTEGEDEFHATD